MTKLLVINIDNKEYTEEHIKPLLGYISTESAMKIKGFRFFKDKLRTLYGELAARYMCAGDGISPSQLVMARGEYGKPYFTNTDLKFNISHSGKYIVCAVCDGEVGVDIEEITKTDLSLARNIFMPSEQKYIQSSKDKIKAFYEIWTAREAYMKYVGKGFYLEQNSFETDIEKLIYSVDGKEAARLRLFEYDNHIISLCQKKQS